MLSSDPLVIALIGPTASGKTDLAIELAKYLKTNIHNVDSRQMYIGMDIGTAKPTKKQQNEIKHFLIDIEKPTKKINVKNFQKIATESINNQINNGRYPILAGGSGLYMNAVIKGFITPQVPPQEQLRKQFENLGQPECWFLLQSCDPEITKKINREDRVRTIRALEVFYSTYQPISSQQSQKPPPWNIIELGLDREDLKERIQNRTKRMFNNGIIEETENIMNKYGADLPLLNTIGYCESRLLINNKLRKEEAISQTTSKTIEFAKKQRKWFRNKNNPYWLNTTNPLKDAIIKIEAILR